MFANFFTDINCLRLLLHPRLHLLYHHNISLFRLFFSILDLILSFISFITLLLIPSLTSCFLSFYLVFFPVFYLIFFLFSFTLSLFFSSYLFLTIDGTCAINPLLPGIRVYALFGFCDIQDFEFLTQQLGFVTLRYVTLLHFTYYFTLICSRNS